MLHYHQNIVTAPHYDHFGATWNIPLSLRDMQSYITATVLASVLLTFMITINKN